MSHVVVHKELYFDNLEDLARAAEACGCVLARNQKTYRWYGRDVGDYRREDSAAAQNIPRDGKCLHAIKVKDKPTAYEAGVIEHPSGQGYTLAYDTWGSDGKALTDRIGFKGQTLKARYAEESICRLAQLEGYQTEVTQDGQERVIRAYQYA